MPSGAEAFQRRQAQREAERATSTAGMINADFFSPEPNTFVFVRFLEQGDELKFADSHRIPVMGRTIPMSLFCLDNEDDGTACPGCQSSDPKISRRITRGYVNLIWRDGPVYERNDYGSPKKDPNTKKLIVTGRADGVFLWNCSGDTFTDLLQKDVAYKGLSSRDCKVTRIGAGRDTKYSVEPADIDSGPQSMTIADMSLAVEKAFNIKELIAPMSYQDFVQAMHNAQAGNAAAGDSDGPQPTMDRSALTTQDSVFNQAGQQGQQASAFRRG